MFMPKLRLLCSVRGLLITVACFGIGIKLAHLLVFKISPIELVALILAGQDTIYFERF